MIKIENKVLCCCFNVTEQDVKDAIKDGVKTFEELQKRTQIGTECPPCTKASEEYFIKELQKTT